jgi:alkanesulfonate monooxygenase
MMAGEGAPRLKLGAFLPDAGHHVAAWRHPDATADGGVSFDHYRRLAQTAERAKFDMVFLADQVALWDRPIDILARGARLAFEPLTLLSALSVVTEHIGLVATASTTYNQPFHLARKFASLDHLSGGRAGWNLVTSTSEAEAKNFGQSPHPEHASRYERAREFVDVVIRLWDSFDDGAMRYDKAAGIFFDPEKVRVTEHRGAHFSVRGPLNVPRPPQGHPVIVQAGSSDAGQELAAATAEVIFTAQQTLDDAQAFYRSVKGRMARHGRSPDDLKIMPGIFPVVGRTRAEAQAKYDELQALIDPAVGLHLLGQMIGGIDLSAYPVDGPIPDLPETNGGKSRQKLLLAKAAREGLAIRQLYLSIAGARGHWTLVGSATDIADQLEAWFLAGGADGFNVMPPYLPGGLDDFVDLVVPELRRRGLFRTEYEGRTLRENLGLSRPVAVGRANDSAAA